MKRVALLLAAFCCILLTGCDKEIKEAADKADAAISSNPMRERAAGTLNDIVDQFAEEFGDFN